MSLLTTELADALARPDEAALVRVIETIFRTGSAGARERMAPVLSADALATPDGVARAQRLLATLFKHTRHFDELTGPAADPAWIDTLAPIAEHAALFHMATLYLTALRAGRAVDLLLRLLEHLRRPGVGVGGPAYALVESFVARADPRVAPALASLLGAPSADDWHFAKALRDLDDPSTAPALRAHLPRIAKKKYRLFAAEVVAHLERERPAPR